MKVIISLTMGSRSALKAVFTRTAARSSTGFSVIVNSEQKNC